MPLYTSYDQVGKKEDVSDVITNISPTKTPFQSMIGEERVNARSFDWQEDSLRAQASNAQLEGFTAQDVSITPTTLRTNYTQILSETVKVSGTADAVGTYGRAKESAYQSAKSMAQVKRDLEHAFVGSAQAGGVGSNVTARTMKGVQAQVLNGGSGSLDADDLVLYTGGTTTLPSEANFLSVLQHLYNLGSDPSVWMITPGTATTVAGFAQVSNQRIRSAESTADMKKVVNVVEIYISPFGEQRVVLNRFLKYTANTTNTNANTLIFDPDMWKKCVLRPWFRETLAKTGDNLAMMIAGEFSLKHKNWQASGMIVQAAGATGF